MSNNAPTASSVTATTKSHTRDTVIERTFCRLKDFRRIAARYDKRADIFLSTILLAAP